MWDHKDPKSKWFHLVVKLIVLLIVFKMGVLVGEFKMVKKMITSPHHNGMMWQGERGDRAMFDSAHFNKQIMLKKEAYMKEGADKTIEVEEEVVK